MKNNTQTLSLTALIILSVCVIAPLTNDIFISGISEMKAYFPGANISLVLSVSLFGLALSQIFYGPLSDKFGRKPVLLMGLLIYTCMSAIVTFSNTFNLLLLARLGQAIGACSAIVSTLAIARDCYQQDSLIKATSLIMAILGAGPASAPLLGSCLNYYWGWRASFACLLVLGCFYLIFVAFFFKETLTIKNNQALTFKNIAKHYFTLSKNRPFLIYCCVSGCSYGVLFSYIALSSYFIIELLGYNLIQFGFIVAANAMAIILMSIMTPKLSRCISLSTTMCLGTFVILIGGCFMLLLNIILGLTLVTFMLPIFITTIGIGMIRPTASAGALSQFESTSAGSAAAFFNFFSFAAGSLATIFTSQMIATATSFGGFIAVLGLTATLLCLTRKTNIID